MNQSEQLEYPKNLAAAIVLALVGVLLVTASTPAAERSRKKIEYKARATLIESEGGAEIQLDVKGSSMDGLRGYVTLQMGGRKLRESITRSERIGGVLRLGSDEDLNIDIEIFPTTSILVEKTLGDGTTIVLEYTDPKTNKWFHFYSVENDKTKLVGI